MGSPGNHFIPPGSPVVRHTVRFINVGREVEAVEGETLFQAARRAGVRIVGACGGRGVCGTCLVHVVSGEVQVMNSEGRSAFVDRGKEWVRACLVQPKGDCVVEVAPRSLAKVARTDVEGHRHDSEIELEPAVRTFDLALSAPVTVDGISDLDRVQASLAGAAAQADLMALRELPPLLRDHGWRMRAAVHRGEIVAALPPGSRSLGLAVDLGTTNAAAFLLDLETGDRLASLGIENPQAACGADLVSRINYAVQGPESLHELQKYAADALSALASDLCAAVNADPRQIVDVAVCGNTAMHHLLLGLPVAQLGRAPFVPASRDASDVKARDVGIKVAAGAYVHVMPNVGGFVGGDHVATLIATESVWSRETSLVIDIGTNTEISLIHEGNILSASCPSGPALEGGQISCGMRAAEGAIERVSIDGDRLGIQVIGHAEPVGLCGSGVLDAVAVFYRGGLVDKRGRILAGHPQVREAGGQREVVLAPGVAFTQHDVRAVQLAKAAIRAGIDVLIREAGLEEADVERVIIAGAFGAYIDVDSAIGIGLLPALPRERFEQVGNAAGVGVRMALASVSRRKHAQDLAARCRYMELSTREGFMKVFLGRIGFE